MAKMCAVRGQIFV